jgi:hypothetical protein
MKSQWFKRRRIDEKMVDGKMPNEKLVRAYGVNPARWPAEAGALMTGLDAESPEAARLMAEALLVDRALDSLPQPAPADAALRAALLTVPYRVAQERRQKRQWRNFNWWPFGTVLGGPLPQLSGLALACFLGLAVGYSDIVSNPLFSFGGGSDLSSLALGVEVPAGLASFEGAAGK